ncbi:hypothetical protein DFH94DRAFT_697441 [Russula ochroleuca]|jgi:hypothetical protein|uniref:Uncharacterized protein n=1 Tax=Russula ochroleuca TaxID=152965 RepID=A0A9P5JYC1_9AGAM|nr:hypothetical protein DFH94DRAFT_697441 [Russula ochroleuca]
MRASHSIRPTTCITPYSPLSGNWGLNSLVRGDTNKYVSRHPLTYTCSTYNHNLTASHWTLSNVFSFVAVATGCTNLNIGTIPGLLNPQLYVPFTAPNTSAVGAGGGPVFVSGPNTSFGAAVAPPPVDLTQQNKTFPVRPA